MKKKLLSQKIPSSIALMLFCFNASFGQQTIGQFPTMDGGFESQAVTTNIQKTLPDLVEWSILNTNPIVRSINSSVTQAIDVRSGSRSLSFTNTTGTNMRIQSPTVSTVGSPQKYTVQYYIKAAVSHISNLSGGIYNSSGNNSSQVNQSPVFIPNTWIKVYATNTAPSANAASYAVVRFINAAPSATPPTAADVLNVDDFVVYAGDLDETAPSAPSASTVSGLNVSWTAPGTGVDGGGYVVVRYASQPASDNNPNQNGIYRIGNTFTSGTNLLQGTVVYIGTNTSFTDAVAGYVSGSDFYKVYTVDKAFNYSSAATLGANQWSVNNPISIYPNPVKDNQFTISLPTAISGKVAVGIYNMSGQLVYKADVAGASNSIAVRPAQLIKAGVYVVKVENNGKTSTQKIIIK